MATNPMPYTFGTATSAIPLSQLDTNFATPITLGNTAVYLNNTYSSIGNLSLANVTITSGTVTITNVAVTTANVSGTANISTLVVVGNETVGGNTTITGNITAANANVTSNLVLSGGTANGVAYLNTSKVLTTGSALTYNGTDLAISGKITSTVANNAAYQIAGAFTNAINADFLVQLKTSYTQIGPSTATPLSFAIAGTQAMTLDASGNLLVGTTSPTGDGGVTIAPGTNPYVYTGGSSNSNANSAYYLWSSTANAYRFYVGYGGTISAVSTSITGLSDIRLKENIRDLDDGLEKVMALQPRKFDWKKGKGANIKDARGFIAQEFEVVFPDMIEQWIDTPPEGEEPYKAVNANLIPTLVKAIQEQQALITTLTARITALEGA